jgi:hypothetical protein
MKTTAKSGENREIRGPRWTVRRGWRFLLSCGRAAAFCAFVFALSALVATRAVYGQVGESALSLGRDLVPFADLLYGAHTVRINGETMYLASAVSDESKGKLLDRFEAACREQSGGLFEEFDALPAAKKDELRRRAPDLWSLRFGAVRREDASEGLVMCVAQHGGSGMHDVIDRLTRLARTGELSELGNLRYAYVRATPTGRSHVLTTFTEGRFNLYRVLGRGGEPPGVDPPGAPRMPGTVRVLSVSSDGAPYGVQSYQTDTAPGDVVAYYASELPKLGWKPMIADDKIYNTAIYERGGMVMSVSAVQVIAGAKTVLTFTEGSSVNPRPDFVAEVR